MEEISFYLRQDIHDSQDLKLEHKQHWARRQKARKGPVSMMTHHFALGGLASGRHGCAFWYLALDG